MNVLGNYGLCKQRQGLKVFVVWLQWLTTLELFIQLGLKTYQVLIDVDFHLMDYYMIENQH